MRTQHKQPAYSPGAFVYTVQQYLWPLWHDVLTTSDRAKADELKNKLGDKARVLDRGMAMS